MRSGRTAAGNADADRFSRVPYAHRRDDHIHSGSTCRAAEARVLTPSPYSTTPPRGLGPPAPQPTAYGHRWPGGGADGGEADRPRPGVVRRRVPWSRSTASRSVSTPTRAATPSDRPSVP